MAAPVVLRLTTPRDLLLLRRLPPTAAVPLMTDPRRRQNGRLLFREGTGDLLRYVARIGQHLLRDDRRL